MWTWSLPWHKVLNAVVAELGIQRKGIQRKVLSDERLGAKLRVTENRCVTLNRSTYVYIYIYIYIYIRVCVTVPFLLCFILYFRAIFKFLTSLGGLYMEGRNLGILRWFVKLVKRLY